MLTAARALMRSMASARVSVSLLHRAATRLFLQATRSSERSRSKAPLAFSGKPECLVSVHLFSWEWGRALSTMSRWGLQRVAP